MSVEKLRKTLFLFDVDGTLTDTTLMDDECFIETLMELFDIDLHDTNWNAFEHVTDSGLSYEIFEKEKGRSLSKTNMDKTQKRFFKKIKSRLAAASDKSIVVPGALEFIEYLNANNYPVAIATGGWRKSAEMKLRQAGIPYEPFTLATSSDNHKRRTIMNVAIARAQFEYQIQFDHMIYFGDGIWDAKTCEAMNIPMIGIDRTNKGHLSNQASVRKVVQDFSDQDQVVAACMDIVNTAS